MSRYLRRLLFFSIRLPNVAEWMKRWETSPREWNISYSAHIHTHTRTRTCMYTTSHDDVSRRSSRQILFRKIGLPLSSTTERRSCASADCPDLTNTHVTCVRARTRLKNFRGYHPNLLFSNIQSIPFLFCASDRDTSRIFGISQPRGMMSPVYGGYRQTIGSRNPCLPYKTR